MATERGTETLMAKCQSESLAGTERRMEEVCELENCKQALQRVKANKGSPGMDGMTVDKLPAYLKAGQLASWVGVCPGSEESAGESDSNRSAKGNRAIRRLLNQLAHAAVRKRDCYRQIVLKRLSVRLGYAKAVLGSCSPPLPIDLEGFARRCPLRRARADCERAYA